MTDFQRKVFSSNSTLAKNEFHKNPPRSIGKIRMTDRQTYRKFPRTLRIQMLGTIKEQKCFPSLNVFVCRRHTDAAKFAFLFLRK